MKRSARSKTEEEIFIRMPSDLPDKVKVEEFFQPMILATIITPTVFESAVCDLCLVRILNVVAQHLGDDGMAGDPAAP